MKFIFSNVGLTLGGKQHYAVGNTRGFVPLACAGSTTWLPTSATPTRRTSTTATGSPTRTDAFVRKFVYGVDVGVGLELPISGKLDALFELRLSPDVSQQYDQPPLRFFSPITGNNEAGGQRRISNVCIELSVGLRLLPEAVYEE